MREHLLKRFSSSCRRSSITKPSKWALEYRKMGDRNWSFDEFPWLLEMHDTDTPHMIGQKSSQMGYTETVLNKTFFTIDVEMKDCLYVLPAKTPDANDFSASRFDPALESSEHLRALFSDVKNIGHKRAGHANLFIRGSRSRSALKSIPVSLIVLDELDEMDQENVPLAEERKSGQTTWQIIKISTPTIDNHGINLHFNDSTQEHFFFPCPHCSRKIELTFPDCLIITGDDPTSKTIRDSHLICPECKHALNHHDKVSFLSSGIWVPQNDKMDRGFYINQLYSCKVNPWEIAIEYLKGLTNQAKEQEFFNSKLGLPHIVEGARVTDVEIDQAIQPYDNGTSIPDGTRAVTMGIDVGSQLHYEIAEWIPYATGRYTCKVLEFGKVRHFEQLEELMARYSPHHTVIDAQPERRKSREFAELYHGYVNVCFYGQHVRGREMTTNDKEASISVDRTFWLDTSLGRFHNKEIILPKDVSKEYKDHVKALVRIYKKDQNDNPIALYQNTGDDHFGHAHNYAEIAFAILSSTPINKNISRRI